MANSLVVSLTWPGVVQIAGPLAENSYGWPTIAGKLTLQIKYKHSAGLRCSISELSGLTERGLITNPLGLAAARLAA